MINTIIKKDSTRIIYYFSSHGLLGFTEKKITAVTTKIKMVLYSETFLGTTLIKPQLTLFTLHIKPAQFGALSSPPFQDITDSTLSELIAIRSALFSSASGGQDDKKQVSTSAYLETPWWKYVLL